MSENNKESSSQQQHSTKSMLRPSLLLGSSLSSSSKSTSTPKQKISEATDKTSNKNNPFLKENLEETEKTTEKNNDIASGGGDNSESKTDIQSVEPEKTDPLTMLSKTKSLPKSNLFSIKTSGCNDSLDFIFGQNVHERVVVDDKNIPNSNNGSSVENNKEEDQDTTNSTSLFASAILKNSSFNNNKTSDTSNKSLTEVAREYEESRAQKRKYEEVETFTGEENEKNIIDINCKLFAFVNSNWEERGRGNLRLNDTKEVKNVSRVVFRTSGNLRLLVNTKVWSDMIAERPSPKSLRLTAMDNNGQVKIFLIMSRPDDISSVFTALTRRIQILKHLDTSNQRNSETESKTEDQKNNSAKKIGATDEPSPKKIGVEKEN